MYAAADLWCASGVLGRAVHIIGELTRRERRRLGSKGRNVVLAQVWWGIEDAEGGVRR
jgi:hypothetical protein